MPAVSKQIQKRGNKGVERLSVMEQSFVRTLLDQRTFNLTHAAKEAGYANPDVAGCQLIKRPAIQAILGREQRRRMERLELKGDEVLNMLRVGLFFNPLTLFKPSPDGKWMVEDLDKIPDEVGRCITKIKSKMVEFEGTVTTYFELELMDKTKLLDYALKHCGLAGVTKVSVQAAEDTSDPLATALQQLEFKRQVVDMNSITEQVRDKPAYEGLTYDSVKEAVDNAAATGVTP